MRALAALLCVALLGVATSAQRQVESKKKPPDPWKSYPTRTLDDLPGISVEGTDSTPDQYGGLRGAKQETRGFFYPKKINGRWWLVDPDGCLFINIGVVSVAPGKSPNSIASQQSRFGGDAGWARQVTAELKAHGFNGVGAWSATKALRGAPTPVVYTLMWNFMSSYGKARGGTFQQPGHIGYPNDCIFVFDPEFEAFCDEYAKQLAATRADPWLLGHFSDNELPFKSDALDRYLALPAGDPGRTAAQAWVAARPNGAEAAVTDADRRAFYAVVVDRYLRITTRAIRKYDPNHLCLGARLYGGDLGRPEMFAAAGRYLDVVSVNYYNAWTPDPERMAMWGSSAGKPFVITEWYTKAMDSGMPNTTGAGWIVRTQKDRGLFYQNFALSLLESRMCVGWHWFKYMDNDPDDTTTDPSNRDSNKGIVSFRYEPYTPLLDQMKRLNQRVYRLVDYFDNRAAAR